MGNTIDGRKKPCPPCRKPWPPRHACPGAVLVTSSTASITTILIHFCCMPVASCPLRIAITSLVSSCCGRMRHLIPRHGEICKREYRIASIMPLSRSRRAGTLIFSHIVHPISLALPPQSRVSAPGGYCARRWGGNIACAVPIRRRSAAQGMVWPQQHDESPIE